MQHPRRFLILTVYALPILAVIGTVSSAAAWLLGSLDDRVGGGVMRGIATAAVLMLIVDALLLLGALGVRAITTDNDDVEPPS
ncbi:MAG: hypothetical protein FJ295_07685 [Planctomycetes bacterium]|nr:hypothetical protein [Planctomycetota bacterium]